MPNTHSDWLYKCPSFVTFVEQIEGTVPLYTCWIGTTHDWARLATEIYSGWQYLSSFSAVVGCNESPWIAFYVYPEDGVNRKPVYFMRKDKANHEYSFILSNGLVDAYSLRDNYGFNFTSNNPMFWVPESLSIARYAQGVVEVLYIDSDSIYDQNEPCDTYSDGILDKHELYYVDADNDGVSD